MIIERRPRSLPVHSYRGVPSIARTPAGLGRVADQARRCAGSFVRCKSRWCRGTVSQPGVRCHRWARIVSRHSITSRPFFAPLTRLTRLPQDFRLGRAWARGLRLPYRISAAATIHVCWSCNCLVACSDLPRFHRNSGVSNCIIS